jgi:hypothetical protein
LPPREKQAAAEAFAIASRRKTRIATIGFGFAMLFLMMALSMARWANNQRKDALAGELIATAENLTKDELDQSLLLGLCFVSCQRTPKVVPFIRF